MVIKLQAAQIPMFWEAIKFAVVQADEVEKDDVPAYLIILLNDLLSDKGQCFVRLDSDRKLLGILVTKITADKFSGAKTLLLQALYSWKAVEGKEWEHDYPIVKEFAKHLKCKYITFESRYPRVWQLGKSVGFEEGLRSYTYKMEA